MDVKDALKRMTGVDLLAEQLAHEQQLHVEAGNDPDSLPVESGLQVGAEIYKSRLVTMMKVTARIGTLGLTSLLEQPKTPEQ